MELLKETVKIRARVVHVKPKMALRMAGMLGFLGRDAVLTEDEVDGLVDDLLVLMNPPLGYTRLSRWLSTYAGSGGTVFTSDLKRHYC